MKTQKTNTVWYEGNSSNHQGLVIDENTGENIAVVYDSKNTPLIASAPELLEACKTAKDMIDSVDLSMYPVSLWVKPLRILSEVITKAEGKV